MTRGAWVRQLGAAFVVWFVVVATALFLGMQPRPALLAGLVAAVGAGLLLFLDASDQVAGDRWAVPDTDPARERGEDMRLASLSRMVGSHLVSHQVDDQLHRQLLRLLDQRLVARHGVSLQADPERAADLAGPELAALMQQGPPYPRLKIGQIDVLIARIEEL